ncbi:MAG TPA: TrmH family RNA methyltransferase, partial [Candidatus Krumholzibacterium sp.]|nr:TrmH family RNA methyltransferase [Candidatus Krumholzibacterium sp.]
WLEKNGIEIITSTPAAGLLYHEADYTGAVAIVVGSEDRGAGSEWLDRSRIKVRIPMNGLADSLNVSVSAAVLAYEALRQRLTRGGGN